MKTINDLYKYASTHTTKLLSNYDGDWWADYRSNYTSYDAVFRRLYYSFVYFMQSKDETVDEIVTNFTADVYNLLLMHDKEFSELYRVKVLDPTSYRLTDNYDMTEIMDKDTSTTLGSRSDSYTNGIGAQSNTSTTEVAPFDSNTFNNSGKVSTSLGARSDTGGTTIGSQSNSGMEDYTLTRRGNIGVMTVQDMLKKQVDFWSTFDFYHYVFGVIARELLCTDNYDGGIDYGN